jgi:hypothetical protein
LKVVKLLITTVTFALVWFLITVYVYTPRIREAELMEPEFHGAWLSDEGRALTNDDDTLRWNTTLNAVSPKREGDREQCKNPSK